MRFTTFLNNVRMMEWSLNSSQGIVFSWLYELPSWAESCIVDGAVFYFAAKSKAVEELPFLTKNVDTMYRHYMALERQGLINVKKINGKDYVQITEKGKAWNSLDSSKNGSDSEINPTKLGNKSENGSEINPTYKNTIINKKDNDKNLEVEKISTSPVPSDSYLKLKSETIKTDLKKAIADFIKTRRPKYPDPYKDLWNIFAAENNLPEVKSVNGTRERKIKARLNEKTFDFIKILSAAKKSDFVLTGGWFSFDWIFKNDTGYLKLMEGNYKNKTNTKPTQNDAAIGQQIIDANSRAILEASRRKDTSAGG